MQDRSDTTLLGGLKEGNASHTGELVSRYYDRIVQAASKRLHGRFAVIAGPDDIAVSVFESLWQLAREKRLGNEQLNDREELWRLLLSMVNFKVTDHIRRESAQKRGGGRLLDENALTNDASRAVPYATLDQFPDDAPLADEVVCVEEQHEWLMEVLGDDVLREVVTRRLEGQKINEIADFFQRSERWVKRKLSIVRGLWERELRRLGG